MLLDSLFLIFLCLCSNTAPATFMAAEGGHPAVSENSSWIWDLPDPPVLFHQAEAGTAEIPRLGSSEGLRITKTL